MLSSTSKLPKKLFNLDFKKCKSMLISNNSENVIKNDLQVDNLKVDYVDKKKTSGVAT